MKQYTVSCIGVGMRGTTYLSIMKEMPKQYKIVSFCDFNKTKLEYEASQYKVEKSNCFTNEDEFFEKSRSELLIIATLDKDHVGHLVKAINAGYKYILVEKPFCTTKEEIEKVVKAKEKSDVKIFVCHVLRYAPAFLKAKEMIDNGDIGKLTLIQATERVGFLHQAHSYVRGHYANSKTSSPMIMAKSCHDLDLFVWYANSKCESLSSYGSLNYFKKENQPVGASNRCKDCKYHKSGECFYDAYDAYFKRMTWAKPWVTTKRPLTDEVVIEGIDNGQYGRCVFDCGNDVVDNQIVNIRFQNGVVATFTMTAFTPSWGRRIVFGGTKGEIILDEGLGTLTYQKQGCFPETREISSLVDAGAGHGGGDAGLIKELYSLMEGTTNDECSSLEFSLESHKMALAAEESRINDGKLIVMNDK